MTDKAEKRIPSWERKSRRNLVIESTEKGERTKDSGTRGVRD